MNLKITRLALGITFLMGILLNAAASGAEQSVFSAAATGNRPVLEAHLEQGGSPDAFDKSGKTLLMTAAENGQVEVTAYLLFRKAKVDQRDTDGRTALMYACRKGNQNVAAILVQAGADVNASDTYGKNVLQYAEKGRNEKLVALLVSCGARRPEKDDLGFAREETAEPYYRMTVHYATNRAPLLDAKTNAVKGFDNRTSASLHYGTCDVSIPKNHVPGELEQPRAYLLEFSYNPAKHVALLGQPKVQEREVFYGTIKDLLKKHGSNEILIFIHGYNVSFADAARRTAQLSYDLDFKGAPLFFSWPSNESLFHYLDDQQRIKSTIPLLKEYLRTVATQFKGAKINIIAHSMGTFGFTTALRELVEEMAAKGEVPQFNQIILAAPDIDAKLFREQIAPKIKPTAQRLTLYASSNDLALIVSNFVNKGQRAGDSAPEILLQDGIDSIDVSRIDTSLLGHSYYGDNTSVITDIKSVIESKTTEARPFLEVRELAKVKRKYWLFNPMAMGNRKL